MSDELTLGEAVKFTGTVRKSSSGWKITYEDAPVPYFEGYGLDESGEWVLTKHLRNRGIIVGKRLYRSMQCDEGIWVPDQKQHFTAYLVSYHLSRNTVMVRLDQMERIPERTRFLTEDEGI